MPQNKNKNKNKSKLKWHQRWWGVIILVVFVVLLIYLAVFIYQVILLIEIKTQSNIQGFNTLSQNINDNPILSVNNRQVAETKDDPYWGPVDAEVVIVEFADFQCPFCKQANPIIQQIRQEYKDQVKIIYRDFVDAASHPQALNAAMAAECADEQGEFWSYHDMIFSNQANLSIEKFKSIAVTLGLDTEQFNKCLDDKKYSFEVFNDLEDGAKLGITGTPAFFINGSKIEGVIPHDTFKEIIDRALFLQEQEKQKQENNK
ncbi:MAG: thioredoxin domain-containing protein [Candidatus Buchananbacteria bacterium]|nr:thioredoxin domain-containing protein [Candidatus Buchananbacteria bacterium]